MAARVRVPYVHPVRHSDRPHTTPEVPLMDKKLTAIIQAGRDAQNRMASATDDLDYSDAASDLANAWDKLVAAITAR